MSRPVRHALDALALFVAGLGALAILALLTYSPGGPRWPHTVVNGTGWALVTLCGLVWLVCAAQVTLRHWRRD